MPQIGGQQAKRREGGHPMRSKKPYRTIDVQRIDAALLQTKTPERWVIAVDVAKEKMVGTINAVSGAQCDLSTPFKWSHPAQSEPFYQLCQRLAETAAVEVVLEPTGTYGDPLVYHLSQRGLAVYLVRPDLQGMPRRWPASCRLPRRRCPPWTWRCGACWRSLSVSRCPTVGGP